MKLRLKAHYYCKGIRMTDVTKPTRAPGRPVGAKAKNDLKSRKFKNVSLDLAPHVAAAIAKAVALMQSEDANAQVQLSAAKYIIDKYGECIKEAYGPDSKNKGSADVDEDDEDEKPRAAILSLVVPDKK